MLRGDHQLNEIKTQNHHLVAEPFAFADEAVIEKAIGCRTGFLGPVGLKELGIPVLVDNDAAIIADFLLRC